MFQIGDKVRIVKNLPEDNHLAYQYRYSTVSTDLVPVGSVGVVERINPYSFHPNSIRVKIGDFNWEFHFDEVDFVEPYTKAVRLTRGIENADRHPILELAQSRPVFVINGNVYTASQEAGLAKDSLSFVSDKKTLDVMFTDRASNAVAEGKAAYVEHAAVNLPASNGNLVERIAVDVLPYLRGDAYNARVTGLLRNTEDQSSRDPLLEKIVQEANSAAERTIAEIEGEPDYVITIERFSRIRDFFGIEQSTIRQDFEQFLAHGNYAILDGSVYGLQKQKHGKGGVVLDDVEYALLKTDANAEDVHKENIITLSKAARIEAIREKYATMLQQRRQHRVAADSLAKLDRFDGDGYGFVCNGHNYFLYREAPAFAVHTQNDEYYSFQASRVGLFVELSGDSLHYRPRFVMENGNGNPYLNNNRGRYAPLCMGNNEFKRGESDGATIAHWLDQARNVISFSSASIKSTNIDAYLKEWSTQNRTSEAEVKRLGIPVVDVRSGK